MINKIVNTLLFGIVIIFASVQIAIPSVYAASSPTDQACDALGVAGGTTNGCTDPSGPNVNSTLKLAINAFSFIVGFAAIIMIIVGGLKYIMSQGESSNTAGAKNTILYAIIGLVIVVLAQVIVKFVLTKSAALPPCSRTVTTNCAP